MSFLSDAEMVIKVLNEYYIESVSGKRPVINQRPLGEIINDLNLAAHVKKGDLSQDHLLKFIKKYLSLTTRLHHPSYLAHQVAAPHYAGALGSLIDGFTNNAMAIYEMGPAASSIEYFMINWLLEKVGWQPSPIENEQENKKDHFAGGVLTHGGSLANLTAMIAARNKIAPESWKKGSPKDLALLAPAGCHYSIARAAGILGIGQDAVYYLEADRKGAIIPDRIPVVYEKLMNNGKRAIALIANACSTAVGIYDPLMEIGDFCADKDLWFHVDGAHGASVLLSEKYKYRLKGVEKADSIVWDAHKLMRVPTLCAALLVRDHKNIDRAFEQEASYIFHDKEQPGFDFIHRTVECTKAGLGLRLFMVLAALGEGGLSEYIEHQVELTMDAFEYIRQLPGFECAVKPQCNILCFRLEGSDNLQLKIRDQLNTEGEFYLSTTSFNNVRYLRLSIMNPHTNLDVIKQLIQKIRKIKAKIDQSI
ncbi:MAG: diaminobutyrate decarboxylase [Desulfobacterales bacterium]|nr:diaminobutyrate decarboxylase [Desulfobacterales bacterium]